VHFSHLWNDDIPKAGPDEIVEVSGGFREAFEGETVDFDWVHADQDGYDFCAPTARPRGRQAHRAIRHYKRLTDSLGGRSTSAAGRIGI